MNFFFSIFVVVAVYRLTSNLSLPESSISEDVKQMAQNFITNKPLDLKAAKEQITKLLADYQFDVSFCFFL